MTDTKVYAGTLLPCPFCGGEAVPPTFDEEFNVFAAGCSICTSLVHAELATEAIAAWNTRIEEPAPAPTPDARDTELAEQRELIGEMYLVWSNEHSAWWGKHKCGYTRTIANAGRYSRSEALSIAGTRDGGWHVRKGNPDEIAIPERDAIDQYADITREQEQHSLTRAREHGSAKS